MFKHSEREGRMASMSEIIKKILKEIDARHAKHCPQTEIGAGSTPFAYKRVTDDANNF